MTKLLNITTAMQLDDSRNQLSSIKPGMYEILGSNSTESGYDFTIENNIIIVGVYLAGSEYLDFTTTLYFPLKLWGDCIFEHKPVLRSIEEMAQYSFYNRKLDNFC